MKSREYGTWPPRNVLGADRQKLYDDYNRSFKKERPTQPKEYASSDVEEYYRVPETKDMSGNPYEQNGSAQSSQAKQAKNKGQMRQNMLRQVAGLVAGSVVVVSSYQAVIQQQEQPVDPGIDEPTQSDPSEDNPIDVPTSFILSWKWSEDNQSAVLELSDSDGRFIKEIPAVVSLVSEAATCNAEGTDTYTATAEDEGKTYSDSRSETLPPLGHAFDEGTETVLEDGQTAMTFECTQCHEQFTVITSAQEND